MISLSLLPTAHPRTSQGPPVRSSTSYYQRFDLAMGRSPPLRVQPVQLSALFGLAFAPPPPQKGLGLPHRLTRRLILQKARHHPASGTLTPCRYVVSGTISLRSRRNFSPFPRGTCSLSVTSEYLVLCRGRHRFMRSFTCIALLRESIGGV